MVDIKSNFINKNFLDIAFIFQLNFFINIETI